MTRSSWAVVAVVASVGVFDAVSGLFLMFSDTPWTLHGRDTVWLDTPALLGSQPDAAPLVESLFRRMGAFQLNAGAVVLVAAAVGRSQPRLLAGFMVLAMVVGLAFNHTDRAAFGGTPYLTTKLAIGAAWALAFAWHLWSMRPRAADVEPVP